MSQPRFRSSAQGSVGLLALAALLLPPSAEAATHLIAIGNNRGNQTDAPLRYAEQDAMQLRSVLSKLGSVQQSNAQLLLSANAQEVRHTFEMVAQRVRQNPSAGGDALVVYYSGHADDTSLHLGSTSLGFEELRKLLDQFPAQVRVLILDSCQSGSIIRRKGAVPAPEFAIHLEDRLEVKGTAIITSSAGSEDSQESDRFQGSFFTHHLVNALKGAADRDLDSKVTLNEAYAYAYRETLRSTGRTLNLQHPNYAYDISGRGDFVFTHLKDHRNNASMVLSDAGAYRFFDDQGHLVAEVGVDKIGSRFLLAPGEYTVHRPEGQGVREYRVSLAAGQALALDDVESKMIEAPKLATKGSSLRHTLQLSGSVQGASLEGYSIAPGVALGYNLSFPWFTMGSELRWNRSQTPNAAATAVDSVGVNDQLSLRLRFERRFSAEHFDIGLGLLAEGNLHFQHFEALDRRTSSGFGAGALLGIHVPMGQHFGLSLEGGPLFQLYRQLPSETSLEELATRWTWWTTMGVTWSL